MLFSNSSADYRPLFWVGRYPVSATTFIIFVHSLSMVVYALCSAFGVGHIFNPLIFSSADVLQRGEVWQLFTYAFVNPPNIFLVFNLFVFYRTGEAVEQFIGRGYFFGLYGTLIMLPALFLLACSFFFRLPPIMGAENVLWGMWVAFVAVYPHMEIFFFRVKVIWFTAVLIGIMSLIYLSDRLWLPLGLLWFSTAVAAIYVRSLGVATGFGFFDRIHEWFETRRMERLAKQNNIRAIKAQEKVESIDNILDKISKHGMGSLTPIEKKILERASADLIKRDKHP